MAPTPTPPQPLSPPQALPTPGQAHQIAELGLQLGQVHLVLRPAHHASSGWMDVYVGGWGRLKRGAAGEWMGGLQRAG
jgi:hypothetical protein